MRRLFKDPFVSFSQDDVWNAITNENKMVMNSKSLLKKIVEKIGNLLTINTIVHQCFSSKWKSLIVCLVSLFATEIVRIQTGERIWFWWNPIMFTKKNIQVLLKEVDKCLNPATKRPTTPEDECNNMLIMEKCPIKCLRVFSNDTYFKSHCSQFI